ncbi:conserved hypothetical protein [Talaromyces stipitatus ATCC 10500]|uniref:Uncharacterized protein n=1 Tax=Talaromyces stipitatus (strain ATCC 10500 / CBS 375.48 / QM 6759 / NRRL 1006) TaxID=441959 RepID=B8MLC5_TALSN|nr:uncharacterized protein TSTA_045040 [Talaromyces stipitatus ATCC 10500]EED15040.1 conserved hypothetical protein [Talaromyces stipitatus ATCC 10500]
MFPWHGEGKGSSFVPATTQRQQPQPQAQEQTQQSSSRQDGYGRWRLSSVLQGQGQDVNDKSGRSSPKEEPIPSSGGDDDEGEEDGEAEEQGNSDEEDIDFRGPTNGSNATGSGSNSTNGTEQPRQGQGQAQRLGERMPPLGYPPQPSFRNNHARRLNTEEEIKLFELCIKHSGTFGERSKLCEWWKNIANEFIEKYGGPYSWHSVRRKVDLVTRQRIKYLADLREGKIESDQATEPWKKVLDEWIPTWEKFEVAEKRRIEVRDARAASRKRKEPAGASSSPSSPAPSSATKRASTAAPPPPAGSWQATPRRWTPGPSPYAYPPPPGPGYMGPPPSTPGMKLPDGYDTMFRTPAPHPSTHPLYPHPPPQAYYPPPNAIPVDNSLTSAILETLTKLNKHLEDADSTSSIVNALTGNDKNKTTTALNGTTSPPSSSPEEPRTQEAEPTEPTDEPTSSTYKKIRAELRAEFQTEMAKMRQAFTAKLDALEQTQEMIMDMLRQEPGREGST